MTDVATVLASLRAAQCPEDVFGALTGPADEMLKTAHGIFFKLAKAVHPDTHADVEAREAFDLLSDRWAEAQRRIKAGTYGERRLTPIFEVSTKVASYEALAVVAEGTVSTVYRGDAVGTTRSPVLIKVARQARDNDLLDNEHRVLGRLLADPRGAALHDRFPAPVDQFRVSGRRVNVYRESPERLTPLQSIMVAYPGGIDARDSVWMWKRALAVLGYAHQLGIVHGAVTPDHLLYDLRNHGIVLVGWGCATTSPSERVRAIDTKYESFYPHEILDKLEVAPGTDLYMLAKCVLAVTARPVPPRLARLLWGCTMASLTHRLDDSWQLHKDIDDLLTSVFGPRKFRPFTLPTEG